ncbi:MAG: type II secretion system protein [Candidatus Dojkabacteria bacterium]
MNTINLPKSISAMTLLELLIVIVIAAVLLTMGLFSLIALRNQTAVRNASAEFAQNLRSVRNDARNGVLPGKDASSETATIAAADSLDFFVLRVEDNQYYRTTCDDQDPSLICQATSPSLKGSIFDSINIEPIEPETGTPTEECNAILMDLATGRFSFATGNGNNIIPNSRERCSYRFTHAQTGLVNQVIVELDSNISDIVLD